MCCVKKNRFKGGDVPGRGEDGRKGGTGFVCETKDETGDGNQKKVKRITEKVRLWGARAPKGGRNTMLTYVVCRETTMQKRNGG